jgi:hypothetical protein
MIGLGIEGTTTSPLWVAVDISEENERIVNVFPSRLVSQKGGTDPLGSQILPASREARPASALDIQPAAVHSFSTAIRNAASKPHRDFQSADPTNLLCTVPPRMSQLEYLIALISIIVGLGITDLAQSVRELVRPSRAVDWHYLPVLWAGNVVLFLLQFWWVSFNALQEPVFGRPLVFLPYLLMFVGLYLACAFALPDLEWDRGRSDGLSGRERREDPLNLEVFYFSEEHRRWFFGTLIALVVLGQTFTIAIYILRGVDDVLQLFETLASNVSLIGLLVLLVISDHEWVHAVVAILTLGAICTSLAMGVGPIG